MANISMKGVVRQTVTTNVLDAVLSVFTQVGTWIGDAVASFTPMFYSQSTGLTFLGVLAVAGLAVSICLLLISIVQRFLHFGG